MSTEFSRRQRLLAGPLACLVILLAQLALSCGSGEESGSKSAASSDGNGFVIQNPATERPYFFDFESVADGEIVSHVYELKNTDSVPITVGDIIPSCSCTNPKISYTDENGKVVRGKMREKPVISVPPGVTADLQIQINTKHVHRKNIDKLASVHLRCDSENRPFMAFELHVIVTKAFQATPDIITMPNTPISSGARGHSDLIPGIPGGLNRVLGIQSVTEGMTASISEVHTPAGMVWRVETQLTPPLKLGTHHGKIILDCTDDQGNEGGEPFHIEVRADIVPDVVMFPPSFIFTQLEKGGPMTAECTVSALAAGHRVRIADTLLQGEFPEELKLTAEPKAADAEGKSSRWKLTLTLPAGIKPPSFAGRVQVTLQDPSLDVLTAGFAFRSGTN